MDTAPTLSQFLDSQSLGFLLIPLLQAGVTAPDAIGGLSEQQIATLLARLRGDQYELGHAFFSRLQKWTSLVDPSEAWVFIQHSVPLLEEIIHKHSAPGGTHADPVLYFQTLPIKPETRSTLVALLGASLPKVPRNPLAKPQEQEKTVTGDSKKLPHEKSHPSAPTSGASAADSSSANEAGTRDEQNQGRVHTVSSDQSMDTSKRGDNTYPRKRPSEERDRAPLDSVIAAVKQDQKLFMQYVISNTPQGVEEKITDILHKRKEMDTMTVDGSANGNTPSSQQGIAPEPAFLDQANGNGNQSNTQEQHKLNPQNSNVPMESQFIFVYIDYENEGSAMTPFLLSTASSLGSYESIHLIPELERLPGLHMIRVPLSFSGMEEEMVLTLLLVDNKTKKPAGAAHHTISTRSPFILLMSGQSNEANQPPQDKSALTDIYVQALAYLFSGRLSTVTSTLYPAPAPQHLMMAFNTLEALKIQMIPRHMWHLLSIFCELKPPNMFELSTYILFHVYNNRFYGNVSIIPSKANNTMICPLLCDIINSFEAASLQGKGDIVPKNVLFTCLHYIILDLVYLSDEDFLPVLALFNRAIHKIPGVSSSTVEKLDYSLKSKKDRSEVCIQNMLASFRQLINHPEVQQMTFHPLSVCHFLNSALPLGGSIRFLSCILEHLNVQGSTNPDMMDSTVLSLTNIRDELVHGLAKEHKDKVGLVNLTTVAQTLKGESWTLPAYNSFCEIIERMVLTKRSSSVLFDLIVSDKDILKDRLAHSILSSPVVCSWNYITRWLFILFEANAMKPNAKELDECILTSLLNMTYDLQANFAELLASVSEFFLVINNTVVQNAFTSAFSKYIYTTNLQDCIHSIHENYEGFADLPPILQTAVVRKLSEKIEMETKVDWILFFSTELVSHNPITDQLICLALSWIGLPKSTSEFLHALGTWGPFYENLKIYEGYLSEKLKERFGMLSGMIASSASSIFSENISFSLVEDFRQYRAILPKIFDSAVVSKFDQLYGAFVEWKNLIKYMDCFSHEFLSTLSNKSMHGALQLHLSRVNEVWGLLTPQTVKSSISLNALWPYMQFFYSLQKNHIFQSCWNYHLEKNANAAFQTRVETANALDSHIIQNLIESMVSPVVSNSVALIQQISTGVLDVIQFKSLCSPQSVEHEIHEINTCLSMVNVSPFAISRDVTRKISIYQKVMRSLESIIKLFADMHIEELICPGSELQVIRASINQLHSKRANPSAPAQIMEVTNPSESSVLPLKDLCDNWIPSYDLFYSISDISVYILDATTPYIIGFLETLNGGNWEGISTLFEMCTVRSKSDVHHRLIRDLRTTWQIYYPILTWKRLTPRNLEGFIESLCSSQVSESSLKAIHEVSANIEAIESILSNALQTPSSQALLDMKQISQESQFHIDLSFNKTILKTAPIGGVEGESTVKSFSHSELEALKSRLNLILSLGRESEESKMETIKSFLEYLNAIFKLFNLFCELHKIGHPNYLNQSFVFAPPHSIESIVEKYQSDESILTSLKNHIKSLRNSHYVVNFFTTRQLLYLVWMGFPFRIPKELHFFHSIRKVIPQENDDSITSILKPSLVESEASYDLNQKLTLLCSRLEQLSDFMFEPTKEALRLPAAPLDWQVLRRNEPNVLLAPDSASLWTICLSLFYGVMSRLPLSDEVLDCTPSTTLEMVENFLRRCFKNNTNRGLLYILLDPENLLFDIQESAARFLKSEMPSTFSPLLVILSKSKERQPLLASLSKCRRVMSRSSYDLETLRQTTHELLCKDLLNLSILTTESPGTGKTFFVKSKFRDASIPFKSIQMNASTPFENIVEQVQAILESNSFLYFNLGVTSIPEVSKLFFRLLILKVLETENGILARLQGRCSVFIEVPNMNSGVTHPVMEFLGILPITTINSELDVSLNNPDMIIQKTPGVSQNTIQYVCKTIHFLQEKKIRSNHCDPSKLPALTPQACQEILDQRCKQKRPLQMNFVKVCYSQMSLFESSPYLVPRQIMEYTKIREHLMETLLEAALDFSSNSLDEAMMDQGTYTNNGQYHHFKLTRLWTDSEHPLVLFNHKGDGSLTALVPSTKDSYRFILDKLKAMKLCTPDLKKLTKEDSYKVLSVLFGESIQKIKSIAEQPGKEFILTKDNLLKMISIFFRLKAGLPAIIMGETGCGKTRLIRFLCDVMDGFSLNLDVHGGIKEIDVKAKIMEAIALSKEHTKRPVYVFFDEINTANCMGLFKECLCDRSCDGTLFPPNLFIIGACNPYRFYAETENRAVAGLIFKYSSPESHVLKDDILDKLVYLVYPIPPSMALHVWDFGSLSDSDETEYVSHIVKHENLSVENQELFTKAIMIAQRFLRSFYKDPSCVSLRDVHRCAALQKWFFSLEQERQAFFESERQRGRSISIVNPEIRSIVLAIGCCYYYRLSSQNRSKFSLEISSSTIPAQDKYRSKVTSGARPKIQSTDFQTILDAEQKCYMSSLKFPPNTSCNFALTENLFLMIVAIFNLMPVLIVGKPGSSKSYAIQVLKNNFNVEKKKSGIFTAFPSLVFYTYQCSPLSTAAGIMDVYNRAKIGQTSNMLPVVLLDEVGLAEQSPELPLKILHWILDKPSIAVVGISNWELDAAKSNRMLVLNRPDPSVQDLSKTAAEILGYSLEYHRNEYAALEKISSAYRTVYINHQPLVWSNQADKLPQEKTSKPKDDYYGLRDFYSFVKFMKRHSLRIDSESISEAVCRNLNGDRKDVLLQKLEIFRNFVNVQCLLPIPTVELILGNLDDKAARHLMLITENNYGLQYLFDKNILKQGSTRILYATDYADNKGELYISRILFQFRECMEAGRCVVLIQQQNIYESLYDVLNQHYVNVNSQKWCYLPIGSHAEELYVVHDRFKCIVVCNPVDAFSLPPQGLPPPFLNRFEKQMVTCNELLTDMHLAVIDMLKDWICRLTQGQNFWKPENMFAAYNEKIYESLVISACNGTSDAQIAFEIARNQLLWIAKPEWVLYTKSKQDPDSASVSHTYFHKQSHQNLVDVLLFIKEQRLEDAFPYIKRKSLHMSVWTHSISTSVDQIQKFVTKRFGYDIVSFDLGCLSSEADLHHSLANFYEKLGEPFLLVSYQSSYCSAERLDHFKFTCLNYHQSLEAANQKHIIIIHYIPRNSIRAVKNQIQRGAPKKQPHISFDRTWVNVYLDSLLPGSFEDVPEFTSLAQRSFSEAICDPSVVDLNRLIEKEFGRAMPITMSISGSGWTQQIALFSRLFSSGGDVEFRKKFIARLQTSLKMKADETVGSSIWSHQDEDDIRLLEREGNLRNTMYEKVKEIFYVELSSVLDIICYGQNLALLDSDEMGPLCDTVREIWLQFLSSDHIWKVEGTLKKGQASSGLSRRIMQTGTRLKFPFSTCVSEKLESYYGEIGASLETSRNTQSCLTTLEGVTRITFPFIYSTSLDHIEPLTLNYVNDFVRSLEILSIHKSFEVREYISRFFSKFFQIAIQSLKVRPYIHTVHVVYWLYRSCLHEMNHILFYTSNLTVQKLVEVCKELKCESVVDLQISYLNVVMQDTSFHQKDSGWLLFKLRKILTMLESEIKISKSAAIQDATRDTEVENVGVRYHLLHISSMITSRVHTPHARDICLSYLVSLESVIRRVIDINSTLLWNSVVRLCGQLASDSEEPRHILNGIAHDILTNIIITRPVTDFELANEITGIILDQETFSSSHNVKFESSLRASILHQCLFIEGSSWNACLIRQCLSQKLAFLDNINCEVATLYAETFQDYLSSLVKTDIHKMHHLVKEHGFKVGPNIEILETLAHRKQFIDMLSVEIVSYYRENQIVTPELSRLFGEFLEGIEQTFLAPMIKYAIKRLYTNGGFHLARTLILLLLRNHPILKCSQIIQKFSQQNSNHIPISVPFSHMPNLTHSHDAYIKTYATIAESIEYSISGAPSPLQSLIKSADTPLFKRAFILAVFDRIYLRYASNDPSTRKMNLKEIEEFVEALPWPNHEKPFLRTLVRNQLPVQDFIAKPELSHLNAYMIAQIAHFYATVVSLPARATPFYKLMFETDKCMNDFWISIADDPRKKEAEKFINTNHGVYVSPNGCLYPVWNCTWPMEVVRCNECGQEDIGGRNHLPLPGHRRVVKDGDVAPFPYPSPRVFIGDLIERAPKGYEVPISLANNRGYTERGLPVVVFRILRFMLHTTLFLSSSFSGFSIRQGYDPAFFYKMAHGDWLALREVTKKSDEDISIILHICTTYMGTKNPQDFGALSTYQKRTEFETYLNDTILLEVMRNSSAVISEGRCIINKVQEMNEGFCEDMEDRLPLSDIRDIQFIRSSLPYLFRQRYPVSIDIFMNMAIRDSTAIQKQKALAAILQYERDIHSLGYLPSMVKWMKYLHTLYDKRIRREDAREIRMDEAIQALSESMTMSEVKKVFSEFALGWNSIRKTVEEEMQKESATIEIPVMNENTPIVFALTNPGSEGKIPAFLIKYMTKMQNDLITTVVLPHKKLVYDESSIDLSLITPLDVLNIEVHHEGSVDFLKMLRSASHVSFEYGQGTQINFDYESLNFYILSNYFLNKPYLGRNEKQPPCLSTFRFSNEITITDTMDVVAAKIPQQTYSPDLAQHMNSELQSNPGLVQSLMRLIEYSINWLRITGGDPDVSVHTYLADNLLVPDVPDLLHRFQLKHIQAFFHNLSKIVNSDPESRVAPIYRQPLSGVMRQSLDQYMKSLPRNLLEELLAALENFIGEYLETDDYEPVRSLNLFLAGYVDFTQDQYPFPNISIAHAWDVFKTMREFSSGT